MPQMSQVMRERGIGMLDAGMTTRAEAARLNVHYRTIGRLRVCFRHLRDRLRPATRTDETIGLHNRRITPQTVRIRLREANLHARRPHRGLDLTAVQRRNRLDSI